MNYLFHFVLSGDDENIVIGNFIADHIRGTKIMNELPNKILKGVLLHRAIDAYSDMHPAVRNSVARLKQSHGRYATVAVDVLYDHFLIKNWKLFVKNDFKTKIKNFYDILNKNIDILPPKSRKITNRLNVDNWFEKYATFEGLNYIFAGIYKRTHFENSLKDTVYYFLMHYEEMEKDFIIFARDLFDFVALHSKYKL